MSVNYVLDVKNLTVGYRNHVAVDDISFNVEKGDLLGNAQSGAGKTTQFFERFIPTVFNASIHHILVNQIVNLVQSIFQIFSPFFTFCNFMFHEIIAHRNYDKNCCWEILSNAIFCGTYPNIILTENILHDGIQKVGFFRYDIATIHELTEMIVLPAIRSICLADPLFPHC